MIKKAIATLGVAAAALVCLVLPAAQAQAGPLDCQNGTSYGVVQKTAPVKAGSTRVGTVMICRDSAYDYWGYVVYDWEMTVSEYATLDFYRYRDGVLFDTVSCDDVGPDGNVTPGQTRCWTHKLEGLSGRWTFRAKSDKYSSHTGAKLATGMTVIGR